LIPRTTNNTQNRCRCRPIRVTVVPTVGTRTCITSIVASRVIRAGGAVVLAKSTPIILRDARRLNTKLLLFVGNV